MKKIKIKYLDWWNGFEAEKYRIHEILSRHYEVEFSDKPDFVICSVYSDESQKYDCVKILYTGENICPDFNLYDYAIGYEELKFGDRYLRVPNYIMNPKYDIDYNEMLCKHENIEKSINLKKEFCSFVYSNAYADSIREKFYLAVSKYKKVNSGGRFLNTVGLPEGVPDKYEFQLKHKFSIAFENNSHIGYTTEKIVQCFASKTIPIYWGDANITNQFNINSFLYVENTQCIDNIIADIVRLDNNIDAYRDMLSTPALVNTNYKKEVLNELEEFLVNIFDQPLNKAMRRNKYTGNIIDVKKSKKNSRIGLLNKIWR